MAGVGVLKPGQHVSGRTAPPPDKPAS
jgi:hypothetical protein